MVRSLVRHLIILLSGFVAFASVALSNEVSTQGSYCLVHLQTDATNSVTSRFMVKIENQYHHATVNLPASDQLMAQLEQLSIRLRHIRFGPGRDPRIRNEACLLVQISGSVVVQPTRTSPYGTFSITSVVSR